MGGRRSIKSGRVNTIAISHLPWSRHCCPRRWSGFSPWAAPRRPDAPRWAIVDEQNTVLVFVTPQAGVNLAPLVGQQVSVRGAQGYMPEYKRPYVVASEARPRLAAAPQTNGDLTR